MLKKIEPQRTPGTKLAAMATAAMAVVIALLLLMPVPPEIGARLPTAWDKLAHLLAFAALAAPLSAVRARFAPFVFAALCAYGGGLELMQPLVGRGAEWADFVMDATGAAIGVAAGAAAGRAWRRRPGPEPREENAGG